MRAAVLLAALLLAVAGCERRAEPAPAEPAAAPAAPLTFTRKTADAEVTLTLPAALTAYPALHRTLHDREVAALNAFADDAIEERAALGIPLPPYTFQVTWTVAAATDRLLSLVREASSYSGGAHPNSGRTTLVFDKQLGREIEPAALLPAAAAATVEPQLCDALRAEKAKRGGVPLDGETWTCPRLADTPLALAPSAMPGKAGGLLAYIDPYVAGPYAEGDYDLTLPAAAVRDAVAPAYRDQFAG